MNGVFKVGAVRGLRSRCGMILTNQRIVAVSGKREFLAA